MHCRLEYKSHYRVESRLQRCFASAAKGPRWSSVASFRILLLRDIENRVGGREGKFFVFSSILKIYEYFA